MFGDWVPCVIIILICFQVFLFVKNNTRMRQFGSIFKYFDSWELRRNKETGFVDGIFGKGNRIFVSIGESINKYLENAAGSVVDYDILKDAVDRHCDTVEEDIAAQTPLPLYVGLAGTMLCIIGGLLDLHKSGAIMALLTNATDTGMIESAADGIDDLLKGVAWAMGASICGIALATVSSQRFKHFKLKEDRGKNTFLAWLQSELLPALPSDTAQAFNQMVVNLNRFNDTFAQNTVNLGVALREVNESYAIQGEIIKAIHDMDVMKMAKANAKVLQELQECTDKLALFNKYLDSIKGYTDAIHRFEEQFQTEADRVRILEEIKDFFKNYKGSVEKTVADADAALADALAQVKKSAASGTDELHAIFVKQSEDFKKIMDEEKKEFERIASEIKISFETQMEQMPQVAKQLEAVTSVPASIDKLIDRIESSNSRLASSVASSFNSALSSIRKNINDARPGENASSGVSEGGGSNMPRWMKTTGWVALIIIALSCLINIIAVLWQVMWQWL